MKNLSKLVALAMLASYALLPISALAIGESSAFLFRLFDPRTGDHFYTTSDAEKASAIRSGYRDEGFLGSIVTSQVSGTTALFRLYNPTVGDHFYTTSTSERDAAIASGGYRSEGTIGFIYTTQVLGTMPLYRLYNPGTADHFYTTSIVERLNAANLNGYNFESAIGFIPDRLFNLVRANIIPNQTLTSPFTVTGEARGNWYFEGSFPVILMDNLGNILAIGPAQATSSTQTTNFVPFSFGPTSFIVPSGTTQGFLILSKDNPSGLPQNADQLVIPVQF